jgi:drug/metabolite transporter (DMT)-like permease
MQTQLKATLLIILSGTCYGLLGYFGTKLMLLNVSLICMLFWRFFIATLCMLPLKKNQFSGQNPSIATLLIYILSYCGGALFYFLATLYIGTGISMVIFFSFPVLVFLFSFFIDGKRLSIATIITLIAIAGGLVLLKGETHESMNLIGIGYALLAAFCYAIYVFANRKDGITNLDSRVQSFLLCLGCTVIFFIASLSLNEFTIPTSFSAWMYILGLSIVATALPIQLMLEGMKHTSAVRASILTVFEPVVTFIVGIVLLHEIVSYTQIAGAIVVLASVTIYQLTSKSRVDKNSLPKYLRFNHSGLAAKTPIVSDADSVN